MGKCSGKGGQKDVVLKDEGEGELQGIREEG